MGSALRREDLVWAKTAKHRRAVERSLELIQEAMAHGDVGVSFSGGKDSTCVLDLVRQLIPGAPAAFFDSGCELPETIDMVEHVGAERITPRMSMLDMARYAGWWGYEKPVDQGCEFDAKRVLIEEPSEAFVVRHGLSVMAHGIRAEESSARKKHVSFRGNLYQGADRTWYLMPIGHWALEDVWAYIASRELRYHASYDAMTNARVPRDAQRVAGMLGERGSGWGRHAILRAAHPEQWHALVREFPRFALDS